MKRSLGALPLGILVAVGAACSQHAPGDGPTPSSSSAPPGAPSTGAAASEAPRDMIVILRDQMPTLNPGRGAMHVRASAIAAAQSPILGELQAAKPRQARSFELVNGFATKLSQAEIDRLSAHPQVLAVVPDRVISRPQRAHRSLAALGARTGSARANPASLCNTLEPEALQLTNAAFLDPSVPQAQGVLDGTGTPVTGKGVKVAFIADGLDTTVPGFTRPDGSPVFIDYQNFTGDPAGTPTAAGEAFGDASSIAAQDMPNGKPLTYDISTFVDASHPLPSPCNIRVRGIAPGASLVGLDVYSNLGYTAFASTWVQAIDWAVAHDDVDVINESFGSNLYPDDSKDPISLANKAAVRAGVTVTASTGDAAGNTFASPANDPWVIGVGATTQLRLYAQVGYDVPSQTGWLDDNISGFSSSGFGQKRPTTPELVAPGDLGWALCATNNTLYQDCVDFAGNGSPVEIFGGTSESAPLAAGAAALVIQAYRSTHGGVRPSPALVKSILMGSATDLGAPSYEQGAGLLDALKAVNTALSVPDENGAPAARGDGLLAAPTSASFTAQPGQGLEQTFLITNTGTTTLRARPALESLAAPSAGGTFDLTLAATAPSFTDGYGYPNPYITQTFTVPRGSDHLDVATSWLGTVAGAPTLVDLYLLDPSGNLAAFSNPQGTGSAYGSVDVVKPTPGTWTALIATQSEYAPYAGPIQLTWSAERYASVGAVFPSQLTLPPGASASVVAAMNAPSQPGDFAAALRLHGTGSVALSEIPFTVRTLIPIGPRGGVFTGTVTGTNGRAYISADSTYAFDVPEGVRDLSLSLQVPVSGYSLTGLLIDPNGMLLSSDSNLDPTGVGQNALELYRVRPQPGRWRFILTDNQSAGTQTSVTFSARIAFDTVQASANLPTSARATVSVSQPSTFPVTVTNTGAIAKAYFVDARLEAPASVTLPVSQCSVKATLPGYCGYLMLPPRVTAVAFTAQSPAPIMMNAMNLYASPILNARSTAAGVVATIKEPEVTFGYWYIYPSLIGPYGAAGAPTEAVTTQAVATMQPFDPAAVASSGNYWVAWDGSASYDPLILAPGATGTINVTFAPASSQVGTTVRGVAYVDAVNVDDGYGTGDELAQLPYAYSVVP